MRKKHVLFDLDGTLTDSQDGILNSIAYMLEFYQIPVPDRDSLRPWLGPPLKDNLMKYYDFPEDKAMEGVLKYREYFDRKGIFENRVYPGVELLLERLTRTGHLVYLATSKPEIAARRVLDYFDLTKYFTFVGGATQDDSRYRKGDVIRYVMNRCGLTDPSQVIMVGDRANDMQGAAENGIESIGALYGYGSLEELNQAGADYIADTVEDIETYV